jgi:hypothetical protein
MVGAPADGERVTELLLDGQQRLTALWRSLADHYTDRTYFAEVPPDASSLGELQVVGVPRWTRNGKTYPAWADSPVKCWQRQLVPLAVLCPGDEGEASATAWAAEASEGVAAAHIALAQLLGKLRQRLAEFNLPFLALPVGTPREVALDVFVKLNTRMVRLTAFDIIVAQVEEDAGESLHDLVSSLKSSIPDLASYDDPEDVVLPVAALLQDHPPSQTGYFALNLRQMIEDWPRITTGAERAVQFLEEERIFDGPRLPTASVLPTLIALWALVAPVGDDTGNARIILRKYLWTACFTDRYERAVPTNVLQDYRALRAFLVDGAPETKVPCFDREVHPLPDDTAIRQASWPKRRDTLARALLALTFRGGAEDIADGATISRESLRAREYHHLYPAGYLRGQGVAADQANVALNCALISWKSNRVIAAQEPVAYLRARAEANLIGEPEIKRRLVTHGISFEALAAGDYGRFLAERAELALTGIRALCDGRPWVPHSAQ